MVESKEAQIKETEVSLLCDACKVIIVRYHELPKMQETIHKMYKQLLGMFMSHSKSADCIRNMKIVERILPIDVNNSRREGENFKYDDPLPGNEFNPFVASGTDGIDGKV